jgi:lipopolysaccharide export system permease protein
MLMQLQTYISKTLLVTLIPIVLLVLGIDFLFALVHELGGVGRGNYTTWDALVYVLLTLPRRLYELFPMTSLIGVLLGLGLLASHSELIVMRASGVSVMRITGIVFQFALLLAVLMGLMGEYVMPSTEYLAESYKARAKSDGQAALTVKGTWVRDGNHFIHIDTMQADGRLQGLTDYVMNDAFQLQEIAHIKEATVENEAWQLSDIARSAFTENSVQTSAQQNATQVHLVDRQILQVAVLDPDNLSMRGLYHYAAYLQHNGLDNKLYVLNFWKKALQPIAVIVMVLLSVPFIFGPLRSASMGLRLLAGIITGFSFYVLSEIFGPLAMVYQLPPFFAVLLPIVLFGLVGLFLGTRTR